MFIAYYKNFVEFDTSLKDLKFNDYDLIINWNLTNNGHIKKYIKYETDDYTEEGQRPKTFC